MAAARNTMHIPTCVALLSVAALLAASAIGQTTTRETVSSTGVQGTLGSGGPVLSADGQFVAFRSSSPNLVPGDTNGFADIFVRNRGTGQTTRVSVDSAGVQANADSGQCYISADGRFVVFESGASNLVAGDTNATGDIFCHDRQTGQTTRVSLGASGQQGTDNCQQCSISADGRFVAFQSPDNTLVPGDICVSTDVFLRDRQLGTTVIVSASNTTGQTFTPRGRPRISADGSTVVFESAAADLVSNDTNGINDVFAWSRLTSAITLVSLTSSGQQGDRQSLEASVSASGRYVVFSSAATNFGASGSRVGRPFRRGARLPLEAAQGQQALSQLVWGPEALEAAPNRASESLGEEGRGVGCPAAGRTRRWGSPESDAPWAVSRKFRRRQLPTRLPEAPVLVGPWTTSRGG